MCFSAGASFTGAAIIGAVGCLAMREAVQPGQWRLALIPMLFALQQFMEGVLWLSIGQAAWWEAPAKYVFLLVALFAWPFWISFALLGIEAVKWRKWLLILSLALGVLYNCLLLRQFYLVWPATPEANILGHSIQYVLHIPDGKANSWLYALVTIFPPFFSSLPYMWLLGALNLIGMLIAYYFYTVTSISLWCFFSAWVSLEIYVILRINNRSPKML